MNLGAVSPANIPAHSSLVRLQQLCWGEVCIFRGLRGCLGLFFATRCSEFPVASTHHLLPAFPHSWRTLQIGEGVSSQPVPLSCMTLVSLWSSCAAPALRDPGCLVPPFPGPCSIPGNCAILKPLFTLLVPRLPRLPAPRWFLGRPCVLTPAGIRSRGLHLLLPFLFHPASTPTWRPAAHLHPCTQAAAE